MTRLEELPLELLLSISQFAAATPASSDGISLIKALSLTCRALREPAQSVLFAAATVRVRSWESAEEFLRNGRVRTLAQAVRSLRVHLMFVDRPTREESGQRLDETGTAKLEELGRQFLVFENLMSCFPVIQGLQINLSTSVLDPDSPSHMSALADVQRFESALDQLLFQNVTSLDIEINTHESIDLFLPILTRCPMLVTLTVGGKGRFSTSKNSRSQHSMPFLRKLDFACLEDVSSLPHLFERCKASIFDQIQCLVVREIEHCFFFSNQTGHSPILAFPVVTSLTIRDSICRALRSLYDAHYSVPNFLDYFSHLTHLSLQLCDTEWFPALVLDSLPGGIKHVQFCSDLELLPLADKDEIYGEYLLNKQVERIDVYCPALTGVPVEIIREAEATMEQFKRLGVTLTALEFGDRDTTCNHERT